MSRYCISFEVLYAHLEILKYLFELFGETQVIIKFLSNDPFTPLRLTSKFNWFTTSLLCGLIRLLKNSWQKVRALAQFILTLFPDSILQMPVLEEYVRAAEELIVNARGMVSEGAANMFLLLYRKKLSQSLLVLLKMRLIGSQEEKESEIEVTQLQAGFIDLILRKVKRSLQEFQKSLIKGSKENLIHGYLSLIRLIFEGEGLDSKSGLKGLLGELIDTLLNVSAQLSKMLSNLGLESETESELKVDCRGHPLVDQDWNESNEDFDNFVVVGIWLALKEAGEALQSIINWIDLPCSEIHADIIQTQLIVKLAYTLKEQLFGLKHRGAIAKAQESFAKLCCKLIVSINPTLAKLPEQLLLESLNEIKTTDVSKILRRSAGIPPLVLSILKAEPNNKTPRLLNLTLSFLFEEYQNAKMADFRVHTLNIMKTIFQDSSLRHDVNQFVSRALKIDIEGFASPNWGIRNSCLMSFTSIARRIFGSNRIQEASVFLQLQSVKKVKGMTTNEFFFKFADLQPFLLHTLKTGQESSKYLTMLLLSRLHPSARIKHSQQESKSIHIANQFVSLLEASFESDDIFVREVGARAILPFIPQTDCVNYAYNYFKKIREIKLTANQTVAYLNLIDLLIQWGAAVFSDQQQLSLLYTQIQKFLIQRLPASSKASATVYPINEVIVRILISILKYLKKHPQVSDDLANQLVVGVSDIENHGNLSPGLASFNKAVLSYIEVTNPFSLLKLLKLYLSSRYQAILTQKYEEFETLLELVFKIIKENKIETTQIDADLARFLVKRIRQAGTKYSLIEKMLKLMERILKVIQGQVDVADLAYLLKSQSPSIQKRIIKIFSLCYRGKPLQNAKFFTILAAHSYADQEDEVRIACVKAWRNLKLKVTLDEPITYDLLRSILFLLVDENPAIRTLMAYYGSTILLDSHKSREVLSLQNEDVLLERVLDLMVSLFPSEIKKMAESGSIYQEHMAKNFGDKIFYYEPLNRFVDIKFLKKRIEQKLKPGKEGESEFSEEKVNWKEEFGRLEFN